MHKVGLVVSLFLLTCTSVFAQGTGTFNGRVVDQAGAVIAGASVTVTNKATGSTRTTVTNSDGLYSVPSLGAGLYDLKAENSGFAPSTKSGVSLVTKSGGNQFHGSAFGYGRSDKFTKIDYFADPQHGGGGKPPYSREQFGGSIGGPIVKDRAWFFGSVERLMQDYNATVPANIVALEQLLVPLNISVLPAANVPQPYHDLLANARFDFQLSPKHTFFFRFAGELTTLWNSTLGASNTISPLPAPPAVWSDVNHFPSTDYALRETWLISPTKVNEFDLQYLHYKKNDKNINCVSDTIGGQGPVLGLPLDQCLIRNLTFPSFVTKNFGSGGW